MIRHYARPARAAGEGGGRGYICESMFGRGVRRGMSEKSRGEERGRGREQGTMWAHFPSLFR